MQPLGLPERHREVVGHLLFQPISRLDPLAHTPFKTAASSSRSLVELG
jgi:hypothetical protein